MMRKYGVLVFLASAMLVVSVAASFGAESTKKETETKKKEPAPQTSKEDKSNLVSEGELSKWLVQVLGLSRFLPASPTENECFAILLQNQIVPKDGWNSTNVVTVGSLARIVVQAMGKQDEVKDPSKDESWVKYLKGSGIEFGTIGEAVENLGLLAQPIGSEAIRVTTDPLKKIHRFRPIDEQQQGTDMNTVESVFSQVTTPSPPPMTPN